MTHRDLLAHFMPSATALGALSSARAQVVSFQTGVANVQVNVSVTRNGQPVHKLTQNDFVVLDEGVAQPIVAFEDSSAPLDLVLLVGVATIRSIRREEVAAAVGAVQQLRPKDRVALISYALDPHLDLPLSSDKDRIGEILQQPDPPYPPGAGTLSWLAVQWGLWLLDADAKKSDQGGGARKRAILMLARDDGMSYDGNSAGYPDDLLIDPLWNLDAAFHAMLFGKVDRGHRIGADLPVARAPFYRIENMFHIAQATGGEVASGGEKGLPALLDRIRSTYSLWYRAPDALPGSLRHISVELSPEAKAKYRDATVQAREGYLAR
jgi:VWFA-related protein